MLTDIDMEVFSHGDVRGTKLPMPEGVTFTPGTYFWRVGAVRGGRLVGDSGRTAFVVQDPLTANPSSPPQVSGWTPVLDGETFFVTLVAQDNDGVESIEYQLEGANNTGDAPVSTTFAGDQSAAEVVVPIEEFGRTTLRYRVRDSNHIWSGWQTLELNPKLVIDRTPARTPPTRSVSGIPTAAPTPTALPGCPQARPSQRRPASLEDLLRLLGQREGLRFVIFRMGTIFGPSVGMRFHTTVNQFCWRAVTGQPIEVWRTASHQFRPYLDLSDAVRAMIFVLQQRQFDARVYNVLTLNATVAHVVEVLSAFVPDLRITRVDSPLMNRLSYCVDTRRFSQLGFEFSGSLERGIGDTVAMLTGARSQHTVTPAGSSRKGREGD